VSGGKASNAFVGRGMFSSMNGISEAM